MAEIDYDTPAKAIPKAFEQLMKDIWTSMPGIVESYDAATRRAVVRPALEACLADGSTVARRAIAGVPVIAPSCGSVTATVCLEEGDAVWLSFSQRGMANFLKTFEDEAATLTSFFSATDAVCFPGFGPSPTGTFTPSSETSSGFTSGMAFQSNDGTVHVSVSSDAVRMRAANDAQVDVADGDVCMQVGSGVQVRLTSSGITLDADDIQVSNFSSGWPKDIEDRLTAGGL